MLKYDYCIENLPIKIHFSLHDFQICYMIKSAHIHQQIQSRIRIS